MKKGSGFISVILVMLTVGLAVLYHNLSALDFSQLDLYKGYLLADASSGRSYYSNLMVISDPQPAWLPGESFGTSGQPLIAGEVGMLVDIGTDKVVFEKDPTKKMKIASLTKIMTAVVAIEHMNLETPILVPRDAATIGENSMGISEGEVYTFEELLYGLILASGNDAAYAIADSVAGDSSTFVKWMNIKAQELGMKDTRFYDPSGLDDATYSTAQDLVKLSRYALTSKVFREIIRTSAYEISSTDKRKYIYLENQTNLLSTYPGVKGIKTGYTEEAGLCLTTYASNEGRELVGVVLNSIDRKGDMILMLDHGFSTLGVVIEHNLL